MAEKNSSSTKSLWTMLFIIVIAHLMSGCGFIVNQPLEVSLAPRVPTPTVNIGGGTKIHLSVLDQRPEKNLGSRVDEAALNAMRNTPLGQYLVEEFHATISASEDIVEVIQKSLRNGFASLGFETLVAPEASAPTLEVAVQHLTYFTLWPSNSRGSFNGTIVGKLHKGERLLYENSYFYFREFRPLSPPIDKNWFEENFNAALSDMMSQLLADLELLKALR